MRSELFRPITSAIRAVFLILIACAVFVISCSKDEPLTVEIQSYPYAVLQNCPNAPSYGDSVLCGVSNGNKDYIVAPLNNSGHGEYYAWPQGLVIDKLTGEINVTQSESGVRYTIGFLDAETHTTCVTNVIVSGINYMDSIYVLSQNDTLARPFLNGDPLLSPGCAGNDGDDNDYPTRGRGNDKCEFDDDEDDDNGDGILDEPPPGQSANDHKVRVRTTTGIINLKKTLSDGAFGLNPKNGDIKDVMIYYRLRDCSQKALRKIKVRLIYYEKKTDIPETLINEISSKRTDLMGEKPLDSYARPRPPLIVITRDLM